MLRILIILSFMVLAGSAQTQSRFGLNESDSALAVRWLTTNCLAPNSRSLRDQIVSRRDVLQSAFELALKEGPTQAEIGLVREGAVAQYRAQREMLNRPELREALPAERLAALREVPEEKFVRTEVDNFVNGYRSNAMAGIAVVGDAAAVNRLRALAKGPPGPLAVAARAALAYRDAY
jgi:hypothetical protein